LTDIVETMEIVDWNLGNWGEEDYTESIDEDGNFSMPEKLYKKFQEKTTKVIARVIEIGLPKKGEQLRLITTSAFNSIAIIKHIADQEKIISAKLVIFAINQSAAKILIELKNEGKLNNCILVISSIRNAGIKDKSIAVEMLKDHFEIIFITSHAKINILETEKGNYYSIEGSGNFSYNARLKQYIIDNDKKLFDFSNEWIKEVEKLKKKKKSLNLTFD